MTSVKELGESLRKRHTGAEGPSPSDEGPRRPAGSIQGVLLILGGCLALTAGGLLASIDVVAPQYAWMAENLGRMGIASGSVLACGAVLLGLGLVAKSVAQSQRALQGALGRGHGSPQVAEHLEELRDSLTKVHFALRVLQESTKGLLEVAHEQSLKREGRDHEDAVYHLAASLDQLGVRLEDRLDSQQNGIERRLSSLDGALEETRRRISEWLELGALAGRDAEDGDDEDRHEHERERARARQKPARGAEPERGAKGAGENGYRGKPAKRRAGGDERTHELAPNERHGERLPKRIDSRRPQEDEELEILVTLEEDEDTRPPKSAPPSLGVLDALDDFDLGDEEEGEGTPHGADASFLFGPELAAKLERMVADEDDTDDEASERMQEKLQQLQSLLSDTGLRKALDELRRPGR